MSRKIEVWEVAISIFLVAGFLMADGQADIEGNTDQLRLRAELQRLESELKRISNPEQLEVEENFQQQKDTPARVREIQQRIGKIQGIQSSQERRYQYQLKNNSTKLLPIYGWKSTKQTNRLRKLLNWHQVRKNCECFADV
jgi:hypothetical protein